MGYTITEDCIGCQRCLSVCPKGAIETDGSRFWIEVSRCDQCQDSYGLSQCWAICPTNEGCIPLTRVTETYLTHPVGDYWESWFSTYEQLLTRLKSKQRSPYWQQWFNLYSQRLHSLQTQDSSANLSVSI